MDGKGIVKFVARLAIVGGLEVIGTKMTEGKRGMVKETIEVGTMGLRKLSNNVSRKGLFGKKKGIF